MIFLVGGVSDYAFFVHFFHQVLFGATALTVNEYYEKIVNFTYPISVQAHSMLIPRPKELSRLYLFIAPFTLDVRNCPFFVEIDIL